MLRRLFWLGLFLAAAPWSVARASETAESKPVAVAAFGGYNAARTDVQFLGKLSGNPELAAGLEFVLQMATGGAGLEGLDKARPWGVVVKIDPAASAAGAPDPNRFLGGYSFVPVNDLDKLLAALSGVLDEPKKKDGLVMVRQNGGPPYYIKQSDGWAFIALEPKWLAELPSDPVTLLGTLTNDYDLAVALDLSAVPEAVREAALARAKADAERELVRNPEETDEEYAARKVLTQQVLRIAGMAARQLDQVTLGWVLDAEAGKTHLDLSVTAKTGSDAAGWFGRLEQTTSRFAGFLEPEATLSGNWSIDFGPADAEELAAVIGALRKKAIDDIDRQEKSPEEKELARKLVNNLLDVAQSTLVTGRFDGGMAVRLAPGAVTLASGKYVAGVEKVDATIRELVETLRRYEPAAVEQLVKLNAAEQAGVQFHTLTVPVNDDNRAAVEQMFGGPVEVVVGLGEESVYAAVGRDALKTLQEYVDRSNPRAAETVAPLEFSLDVGQMAAFAAKFAGSEPERQQARKLAEALAKAEGDADRVTLTAAPIAHGVRLRLDVEDGILKALGELARQRQTGGK